MSDEAWDEMVSRAGDGRVRFVDVPAGDGIRRDCCVHPSGMQDYCTDCVNTGHAHAETDPCPANP